MTDRSDRWLAAAGLLGAAGLGLPWEDGAAGTAHPSRVLVVAAVVLALTAVRAARPRLLVGALGAVGGAAVLGGWTASPGRLAVTGAALCLALAVRSSSAARRAG